MRPTFVKNRVIAGVAALAVVVALVGLAVVAGSDNGSSTPATLPVLGSASGGGEATPSAAMADSKMRFAPTRYEAGKLPGLADEADAWELAAGGADEGRIAELAKLLDVSGPVTRTEYGWKVGTESRRLDVQDVAGLPWSLYESVPVASTEPAPPSTIVCIKAPCEQPTDGAGSSGSSGSGTMVDPGSCAADACGEPMEAQRPADLPSKDEAERAGRALLADLGVDIDHATVRVDDNITLWNVVADPMVGGLPTIGLTSSVGIGPKGVVQYANGWLGTPTKGDRYPLIGVAAGLERLNAEQAQIMVAPTPDVRCLECDQLPPTEPRVVRVTGVRLGLQVFSTYQPGADGYLVPTYLFSTEDGGEVPAVAVADQYLGQAPTPEEPDPGTPAEPSGTGQCSASSSGSSSGPAATSVSQPEVQVCVTDPVLAGRPATFTVTAKGNLRDDCGSPVPEWGDGEDVAVCDIGCESLPAEPRGVEQTFEHTYAKAGTYTAVFHFKGCGADAGADQASGSVEVRVGT
ncbi:MAG: hypothetical protein JWO68_2054 [Actinomycetia bacterium]|nr:hypothetical protein [Actinomycetes bacterium]